MRVRVFQVCLGLCFLAGLGAGAWAKDRPYLRTPDEIAALRKGWTPEARAKALARWQSHVQMSDEATWALLPGPKVYRAMDVNLAEGCPKCGQATYTRGGFRGDLWKSPWKLTCRACGEVFPKNDFLAFYRSGLGPDGRFDPALADRKLLVNTDHSDPNDPLHAYGVDDGTGWVDAQGRRYWFVARCCWLLWSQVTHDARAMADDYQQTGAVELAHKAAILLVRMADTYPEMDFSTQGVNPFSYKLGGDRGKTLCACNGEAPRMRSLPAAYDDLWDIFDRDAALVAFLTKKAQHVGHPDWGGSAAAIRRHIEEHLIVEGARDVMRDRARGNTRYGGDVGHMEWTLALQALVLDDAKARAELLAWPLEGPYPLKGGMHEVLCGPILGREGAGGSSSPGYSSIHYKMARTLADLYARLDGPQRRDLYAAYPCIQKSYDTQFSLNCCERYSPHIGDAGQCGNPGLICNAATMIEAFEQFGQPRYARMAYFLNGHSTKGFAEPLARKVQTIVDRDGDWRQESTHLNGYGLAILRSGTAPGTPPQDQRAAWLYYGRAVTNAHSHDDRLNIGLFARGLDLMPDLGYPERTGAWPKRGAWTKNTLSHNTMVVDRVRQKAAPGGNAQVFFTSPLVKLVDAAREAVYPQTSLYRRVYALVDVSDRDSYLVDVFRVKGGREHHYSFHSAEGPVTTEGLTLVAQPTGTLAGPDVAFAQFDPKKQGWDYPGIGFPYLREVQRDARPTDRWSVTWHVQDTWNVLGRGKRAETDVRLRLTMLGAHQEVIVATGEPPRLGKPDNPESLKYLLVHNRGEDLASVVAAVIEPFAGQGNLAEMRRIPVSPAADDVAGMEAVALEIRHRDGTIDYVLSAHDGSVLRKAGPLEFAAAWAFARVRGGQVVYASVVEGTALRGPGLRLDLPAASLVGTIADMDRRMSDHNCVYTDAELPTGAVLAGSWMRIANDGRQDACYEIREVRREQGRTVVDLGDITLVRQVKDPRDYDAGYLYNFEVGQTFAIPAWVWVQQGANGRWETRSNCRAQVAPVNSP